MTAAGKGTVLLAATACLLLSFEETSPSICAKKGYVIVIFGSSGVL
jgi:hypothetical protein